MLSKGSNMKRCSRCKQMLDESMFYKNSTKVDGLSNECKACAKESAKLTRLNSKQPLMKQVKKLCYRVYQDPDIDTILDLQQAVNDLVTKLELERI